LPHQQGGAPGVAAGGGHLAAGEQGNRDQQPDCHEQMGVRATEVRRIEAQDECGDRVEREEEDARRGALRAVAADEENGFASERDGDADANGSRQPLRVANRQQDEKGRCNEQ
jgi:hypothetical protein